MADPTSPSESSQAAAPAPDSVRAQVSDGVAAAIDQAEAGARGATVDTGLLLIALAGRPPTVRAPKLLTSSGLTAERLGSAYASLSEAERIDLETKHDERWTDAARTAVARSTSLADEIGAPLATLETLLLALLSDETDIAVHLIVSCGGRPTALRAEVNDGFLSDFHPLVKGTLLGSEKLPLFGRADELARVAAILGRNERNLPALIGSEGVGKRSIAERVAWLIRNERERFPAGIGGRRTVAVDLPAVVADKPQAVTDLIDATEGTFMVFLTSLRALTLAPATTAGIIKPAILARRLRLVLALTPAEAAGLPSLDPDLLAVVECVNVSELGTDFDEPVTDALTARYADVHQVTFTPEAAQSACALARRYLRESAFPGSLAVLLDDVSSRKRYAGTDRRVTEADVSAVVSVLSGVPVSALTADEAARVLSMEARLHERIIGQEEAVSAISRAIRRAKAGIKDPRRPTGSFIFLGPTGVGKTELAKAVAEFLFGSESALIQFDMSEYGNEGDVTKLIGSGPQWIGHDEGGQLTKAVKEHPYSVLLFDEVEKAYPEIFDVFLQVLEEGRLTDGSGMRVDFANVIVILTSNLGMQHAFDDESASYEQLQAIAERALHDFFRPELLNRLDETIVFHPLERDQVRKIADLLARQLGKRAGVTLTFEPEALDAIVAEGYDRRLGARPLRRALSRLVEDPLANLILDGSLARGGSCAVIGRDGKVELHPA